MRMPGQLQGAARDRSLAMPTQNQLSTNRLKMTAGAGFIKSISLPPVEKHRGDTRPLAGVFAREHLTGRTFLSQQQIGTPRNINKARRAL